MSHECWECGGREMSEPCKHCEEQRPYYPDIPQAREGWVQRLQKHAKKELKAQDISTRFDPWCNKELVGVPAGEATHVWVDEACRITPEMIEAASEYLKRPRSNKGITWISTHLPKPEDKLDSE